MRNAFVAHSILFLSFFLRLQRSAIKTDAPNTVLGWLPAAFAWFYQLPSCYTNTYQHFEKITVIPPDQASLMWFYVIKGFPSRKLQVQVRPFVSFSIAHLSAVLHRWQEYCLKSDYVPQNNVRSIYLTRMWTYSNVQDNFDTDKGVQGIKISHKLFDLVISSLTEEVRHNLSTIIL